METKNKLLALIAQSLIILAMPFNEVADFIGAGATTTTVGATWDALVASGDITPAMVAEGEAMMVVVNDSAEAIRLSGRAAEYEAAERELMASLYSHQMNTVRSW